MKQIRFAFLIACACCVSAAWGQESAANSLNNWSEYHRTDMVRYNPYEDVLNIHNVGELQLKWSYSNSSDYGCSGAAIANGVVYAGFGNGEEVALNATTGAKLWSYQSGNSVYSYPAVANGIVYFGSNDDNVYALNATTGHKLWSYATGNSVFSSPTVTSGVVYVGSADNNVYALNGSTCLLYTSRCV